ncbi:MAG: hypothetical protein GYA57_11615 [Myxococcales bacterium]|nr:hypothetical protein [Myxococcales bacterium]
MTHGRLATLFLAATALVGAASCDEHDDNPCAGVTCSSRGFCLPDGRSAYCVCLPGFHPVSLSCVADDPANPCEGVDCSDHGACRVEGDRATCDCQTGFEHPAACEGQGCDLLCLPPSATDGGGTEDAGGDTDADGDARDAPDGVEVDVSDTADVSCDPGLTPCGTACVDTRSDPQHCGGCETSCPRGADCVDGVCTCPGELVECSTGCTDVLNDPRNCGSCEHRCPADSACEEGACRPIPP